MSSTTAWLRVGVLAAGLPLILGLHHRAAGRRVEYHRAACARLTDGGRGLDTPGLLRRSGTRPAKYYRQHNNSTSEVLPPVE